MTAEKAAQRRPSVPLRHLLVLTLSFLLLVLGAVAVLSASSPSAQDAARFSRHMWYTAASVLAIIVCMGIPARCWRRSASWAYGLAVLFLAAVPVVGHASGGARRWLLLGPVGFQPSEFSKLALILAVAALVASREDQIARPDRVMRPALLLVAGVCVPVLLQPDMGTAMILAAIGMSMLFAAGVPMRMLSGVMAFATAAAVAAAVAAPYRRARLTGFVNPFDDRTGDGYHTAQSLLGLSRGGLTGVGMGQGQAKWGWLPNSSTDFVFAVLGEELGLLGTASVLLALFALVFAALRTARRTDCVFSSMVASGIAAWFLSQTVVNTGAAVGLLPVTGAPLPFLSLGGSSMLAVSAASGILLSVTRGPPSVGLSPGSRQR